MDDGSSFSDVLVVGAGPAGLLAALAAARAGGRVRVCEAMDRPGLKLLASGGGRCNLTNTLDPEQFMERFGRYGRFMAPALAALGAEDLRALLDELGVPTHAPDGFRVFPVSHCATDVHAALLAALAAQNVALQSGVRVQRLLVQDGRVMGVEHAGGALHAHAVVLATGGLGYPALGGSESGYNLAAEVGHRVTGAHPAMVPLLTKQTWVADCRADTLPKVHLRVLLPKHRRVQGRGDLIFTRRGIAGPVVLDLAREITPLLGRFGTVPMGIQLQQRWSAEQWANVLRQQQGTPAKSTVKDALAAHVPGSLAGVACRQAAVPAGLTLARLSAKARRTICEFLSLMRLDVAGSEGYGKAMVTRGGVSLRDVDPQTMGSRCCSGVFLAGEMLDLDGPCGGYNLQWAFSSGWLAGTSAAESLAG